jgi:acyl-CoA thioesterase-1
LLAIVGILAVALSTTAIPYWAYGLLAAALVIWAISNWTERRRSLAAGGLVATCVLCVGLELPYHLTPRVDPVPVRSIAILGDSVTAGLGENGENRPSILAHTTSARRRPFARRRDGSVGTKRSAAHD